MAKSLTGGGVDFPIRASSDQLKSDLEQGKQLVKQAAAEMRATANVAINAPGDLGAATAATLRGGNVNAAYEQLKRRETNRREREATRNSAVAMYQQDTGLVVRDRAQIAFERDLGRQRASEIAGRAAYSRDTSAFHDFIADRNRAVAQRMAGALSMSEPDLESGGAMDARRIAQINSAASRAAMLRNIGVGAAAVGVGLYGVDSMMRSQFASRNAFLDASDRYSFGGRSAFNDSTLRAAASTQGSIAGSRSGFGAIIERLPVVGALFTESLERAARSADQLADSHRRAVSSLNETAIARAGNRGEPLEAMRLQREQELKEKRAEFDKAARNARTIQQEGGLGRRLWENVKIWDDLRLDRERRQGAAERTAKEAQKDLEELEKRQKEDTDIAERTEGARIEGIRVSGRSERYRGAELGAERRGSSIQAFAVRRARERMALDQRILERGAAARGQFEIDAAESEGQSAVRNFQIETQLQARQLSLGRSGRAGSVSEAGNFGRLNRERYFGEQRNFEAMGLEALRQNTAALVANTDARNREGQWEDD